MFDFLKRLCGSNSKAASTPAAPPPVPISTVRVQKKTAKAPALDGKTRIVDFSEEKGTIDIPAGLACFELNLSGTSIEELPAGISVSHRINLSGCERLVRLPAGLRTGTLDLSGCTSLRELPENLQAHFIILDGCRALETWPASAKVSLGRVSMRGCSRLTALPPELGPLSSLDLGGCRGITAIPDGVRVTTWIDIKDTGVKRLPPGLHQVGLRWGDVRVPARVIFEPETLTGAEVLAEPNAEVRRWMLERVGVERFIADVHATVRDADQDPGGERKLLVVELPDDEPLVCVTLKCPSTGRQYVVRVPPTTKTCVEAVAWTAGFDNPANYRPVAET